MTRQKKKEKKISLKPYSAVYWVVLIGLLLVEAAFVGCVVLVNILPIKFLAAGIGVLLVIDLLLMLLMGSRRSGNKRLLGVILSLLMACILLMGGYYMYNTYNAFQKVTEVTKQYDVYYVLVAEDSNYEEVGDITGKTVYAATGEMKTYVEAKGKLQSLADITYEEMDDAMSVAEKLLPEKDEMSNLNVALLSKSNYGLICEEEKGYKGSTRIIYKIKIESRDDNNSNIIDVTQDPFNIYITGIDVWGSIDRVSRSDVNMIMTVNPKTRQILLTSIPRDAYVKLHSFGQMDKLTHTGIYGVDETTSTVEDWLGIEIDYYVRANFDMVVKLVNAMGGIKVWSDYEFDSSIANCHYVKGWNKVGGKAALFFARERKCFSDMDQQRVKNQQRVVKAIIKKLTTNPAVLANYNELLSAVSENMQTDMSQQDITRLVKMQLNDMDKGWRVNTISIRGDMASKGTYSMGMGRPLDVCIMQEDSAERAVKLINNVMYPSDDKKVDIENDKSEGGTVR